MGTGDDTVEGGAGNDSITVQTLSNGDSLVGGDGTDTLTIAAIASTSTPKNISTMENVSVTALGAGAASMDLDLTNVSGLSALTTTINTTGGNTLTVKNAPSTLATLNLDDSGNALDTLAISYASGPTSLTLNAYDLTNAATNITSLNAPLTISGKMNTNLAGTAQVYAAGQVSSLGTMSTDATSITVTTDAHSAGVGLGTAELTIGAITDNVLETVTVNVGAYSDAVVSSGDLTTTNAEFSSASLTVGQGESLNIGELVANSATAVSLSITTGDSAGLTIGNAASTFNAANVTVSGTLGDQSTISAGGAIVGENIVSSTFTGGVGMGSANAYATLPAVEVDSVSGVIGPVTLNTGIAGYILQTVGSTTTPADIAAITATGGGHAKVTLGATAAATYTPAGGTARSSQGNITGASMTSPLSSLHVVGTNAVGKFTLTGGAGNDTLVGGKGLDTITGGLGTDNITTGADADIVIFTPADSPPVYTGIKKTATGTDTVADNGTAATTAVLQFNITSTDATWAMDHIMVGTAGATIANSVASATQGNTDGYAAAAVLVHTGATAAAGVNTADPVDVAVIMNTPLNVAQARAVSQINITGTGAADTITTGANNDTINGGVGDDTVTGGEGADSYIVSSGDDTVVHADGAGPAMTADSFAGAAIAAGDTLTFGNGLDIVTGFEAGTGETC